MRIIILGDTHIGANFGLGKPTKSGGNSRVDDYERTLNNAVDYAIDNKVDAFIQTGDAFDSRTPAPEHMNVYNRAVRRLSLANITSIIIMGNHDYRRVGDGFTSAISSLAAKDYPNVRIILKPELIKLHGRDKPGANLVLLPFRDRRMFSGKTTAEDSKLYEDEVRSIISLGDPKNPTIAVGHNFYHTGSYNDYGGTEVLAKVDTFNQCDLIAMGHYHQFKIIRKKDPIAIYTGSMEKLNFGDEKVDKYFIDYETETKRVKVIKSPSRQLKDISLDLSDSDHDTFMDDFKSKIEGEDFKDKITRLKVSIRDSLLSFVKKSHLEKILYDEGAFFVSRITLESVFSRVVRDDAILKHKDDFSMFKAFVDNQEGLSDDDKKIILSEAKKIMV